MPCCRPTRRWRDAAASRAASRALAATQMPALSTPTELPPSPFGEFGGPAVPIIAPCLTSGTTVASEVLTCSTPPASDAGISRRLVFDFDQGVNLTTWLEASPDSPRPSSLPASISSAESELQGDARINDGRCAFRRV